MANGPLTAHLARGLRDELAPQALDVLQSHGQQGVDPAANLGRLCAWYSSHYAASTILTDLDIAVVQRRTERLLAIVEIEETTSTPKVLLGDVLAMLLGSHITFQGTRQLSVGPWTTLIVLAPAHTAAMQRRIAFLAAQVEQLRAHLATPHAAVGYVVMDGFATVAELGEKLRTHLQAAITAGTRAAPCA